MDSIDFLLDFQLLSDGLTIGASELTTEQEKDQIVPDDAHCRDWETLGRRSVGVEKGGIDFNLSYWDAYKVFAYNSAKHKQIVRIGRKLEPVKNQKQAIRLGLVQLAQLKSRNGEGEREYTDEENIDHAYYDEYYADEMIPGEDLSSFEKAYYESITADSAETKLQKMGNTSFETVFDAFKFESDFNELYKSLKESITGNRPRQKSVREKIERDSSGKDLRTDNKWIALYPLYKWKRLWKTTKKNNLLAFMKAKLGGSRSWITDFQDRWIRENKDELLGGDEVKFQREDLIKAMNSAELSGPQYTSFLLRMHGSSITNISNKLFITEQQVEVYLQDVKKPIVKEFCLSRIRQHNPEKEGRLDEFSGIIAQIEDALEREILKLDERIKYDQR